MRVIGAVPGSVALSAIVREFERHPNGVITSFDRPTLTRCREARESEYSTEIMEFGTLVSRLLTMCGEEVMPLVQSRIREAVIARACAVLDDGTSLAGCRDLPGVHRAVDRTLRELSHWGIEEEEMLAAAEVASPALASRLRSLAAIAESMRRTFAELGYQTSSSQIRACLGSTAELDGAIERVLVFMGSEVHPMAARWLRWLADQGVEVTVVLDRHAAKGQIFLGAARTAEMLGSTVEEIGGANRLMLGLFGTPDDSAPLLDEIGVRVAYDPLAEVEWILRECARQSGPCGMFVRHLETYAPLIDSASRRLGIPVRMRRRAPLLTNSFARLTLRVLQACADSDVRSLGGILSSSYLSLSGDQRRAITTILRDCHRMKERQWESFRTWVELNREEYPWLLDLLDWRTACAASEATLVEWQQRLRELIDKLPWHDAFETGYATKRDATAQNQLQLSLVGFAQIDRIGEGGTMNLRSFVRHARKVWEISDVSIPPTDDANISVSSEACSLVGCENVFVLEALEGVFPRRRSEDPILPDAERAELSALMPGLPPLCDSKDAANAERDEFYRICAAAGKRLIFSYSLIEDEQSNIPSFYLEAVLGLNAAKNQRTVEYPRSALVPPADECASESDAAIRKALDGERETSAPVELCSPGAIMLVASAGDDGVTPSQLRDANQCPFKQAARYSLGIEGKRRSSSWNRLLKLPIESGLITAETREVATQKLQFALEAHLDREYGDIPDWEAQLQLAGGKRLIRDWVAREFASREHWTKQEGSVEPSVEFGSQRLRGKLKHGARLKGKVDGISRLGDLNVAYMFWSRGILKDMSEHDEFLFGLHMIALYEKGRAPALEIDSTPGLRYLLLVRRPSGAKISSPESKGLKIVDMSNVSDPLTYQNDLFLSTEHRLADVMSTLRQGIVDARSGDYCASCEYGELCRRSQDFGEEEAGARGTRTADDE